MSFDRARVPAALSPRDILADRAEKATLLPSTPAHGRAFQQADAGAGRVDALAVGLPDVFHAEIKSAPRRCDKKCCGVERAGAEAKLTAIWRDDAAAFDATGTAEKGRHLDVPSLVRKRAAVGAAGCLKKRKSLKIDMVVWRNKQGHPPMVTPGAGNAAEDQVPSSGF